MSCNKRNPHECSRSHRRTSSQPHSNVAPSHQPQPPRPVTSAASKPRTLRPEASSSQARPENPLTADHGLQHPSVSALCSCLTQPLPCAAGASGGCVAGQPDWRRTVASTGCVGTNSSFLMELLQLSRQRLRVFMYSAPTHAAEPKPSSYNKGYSVEGAFHARLAGSRLRTSVARAATLFYVPVHPIGCHSQKLNPHAGGQ